VYGKGDLNLVLTTHDSPAAVQRNRAAFLREIGAVFEERRSPGAVGKIPASRSKAAREMGYPGSLWPLVTLRQIHSDIIHCVDAVPEELLAGDRSVSRRLARHREAHRGERRG
jgi:hypothetical protein